MMGWQSVAPGRGGGPAFKKLEVFQLIRCFLGPCSISSRPEESRGFESVSFLEFDLSNDAWDRIIAEYLASDLARVLEDRGVNTLQELDGATRELEFTNPDNLVLSFQDVERREPFDTPVGASTRGASGPSNAPPPVGAAGPPELRFLQECAIPLLEDHRGKGANLWPLAYLAGMMGPVGTKAVRSSAVSTVQLTSALVSQQLVSRFGCATDGAKAVNLRDFLNDTYLPGALAAPIATEDELRREARDACLYRRSEQGRLDVEISRLPLIRAR